MQMTLYDYEPKKECMNVLVACEESQRVCMAFRNKGHMAFSCDIQECSGGHPEWHIQGDVLPLLNGNTHFVTQVGGATRDKRSMGFDNRTSSVYLPDSNRQFLVRHTEIWR